MAKKEVLFFGYCPKCKYYGCENHDDPCNECLAHPWNEDSRKPVCFEENDNDK